MWLCGIKYESKKIGVADLDTRYTEGIKDIKPTDVWFELEQIVILDNEAL